MSDRELRAQITAVDKASPVFAKVANEAAKMGKSAEQAGQQATRSFKDMEKSGRDVGIGIAALGAAFVMASRSAVDQARQIDAINRLYGESADAILRSTEAIQDNTNFSNDAARQAEIIGATLVQNYGLAADQIAVLTERSADLAQIHGVGLADAMSRVSGAIRGEGEAAELLGLNMSDSATAVAAHAAGLTGWTTTMTEAEKAAFRYQLVLQQTTATQGAAADAADTTRGRVREIADTVQDAAQGFAAWTGPIGEATAALSENALEIVVVGAGLAKLVIGVSGAIAARAAQAAAAQAAAAAEAELTATTVAAAAVTEGAAAAELELAAATEVAAGATVAGEVASAGLLATLGPLGLVAAAAAAAFGIYKLVQGHHEEADAAEAAAKATADLATVLHDLQASGSSQAGTANAWVEALTTGLAKVPAQIQGIRDQMTALAGTDQPQAIDPNATDAASAKMRDLEKQLELLVVASADAGQAQIALGNIFQDTGVGADLAREATAELYRQYSQDQDIVKLIAGIIRVGSHLGDFDITANEAAAAAKQLAIDASGAADGFDVLGKAVADLGPKFADTAKGQQLLSDLQLISKEGTDQQRESIAKLWAEAQTSDRAFAVFSNTVALNAGIIRDHQRAVSDLNREFERGADRQAAYQEGLSASIAGAQAAVDGFLAMGDALHGAGVEAEHTFGTLKDGVTALHDLDTATSDTLGPLKEGVTALHDLGDATADTLGPLKEGVTALHGMADATGATLGPLKEGVTALHGLADATTGTLGPLEEGVTALHGIEEATAGVFDELALGATAFERLANGSLTAGNALGAFKEVQDGIIDEMGTFSAQASEYGSAVNAMEKAHEILAERQQQGIELTREQTEFMDGYDAALARATGGVEDAQVQQGILAERYAENMKQGDALNENLAGTAESVDGLAASIDALTVALGGVPPEVKSDVVIPGIDDKVDAAGALGALIDQLDEQSAEPTITLNGAPESVEQAGEVNAALDMVGANDPTPSVVMQGIAAAVGDVGSVQGVLDILNGSSANPAVGVIDNASGTLSSVAAQLAALDGASATAFINTVTTNTTNNITNDIHKSGFRHGGIVPHEYARHGLATHGWTAITVGEAGRETILAPGGSYVRNAAATAAMGGGTGGGVNLTANFYGDIHNMGDLEEVVSALAGAVRQRWASLGM